MASDPAMPPQVIAVYSTNRAASGCAIRGKIYSAKERRLDMPYVAIKSRQGVGNMQPMFINKSHLPQAKYRLMYQPILT